MFNKLKQAFNSSPESFKWITIASEEDLEELKNASHEKVVLLFKHSTRCSISSMAKRRLESESNETPCYYLDLIQYRPISNLIASEFGVTHESPQVLLIKNGKCIFHTSHNDISWNTINSALTASS